MRRHAELPCALLALGDLLAAAAAALGAYWLRFEAGWIPVIGRTDELPPRYLEALPVAITLMLAPPALTGMYARAQLPRHATITDAVKVGALTTALLGTIALFYRDAFQYSRLTIALVGTLYVPTFLVGRSLASRAVDSLRSAGRFRTRIVVVGSGAPAERLARTLDENRWLGIDVVGVLAPPAADVPWTDVERLTDEAELESMLSRGSADEVYVALPATEAHRLGPMLRRLEQSTSNVRVVPDLGDAVLMHPDAAVLSGLPVISIRDRPLYGLRAVAKRVFDVALAAVLLATLSPLLLLIAVIVRASSTGPALFRQERMGLDGHSFGILKFRTMRANAEEATGPVFARPGDPRTTTFGRFLRRFSLDELPQLINVLRGEMSLVGPRPERAPFIAEFRECLPGYMLRHSVKAGMTGWAQVHGLRGGCAIEDRLRYDLEYIDRWSLLLDLEILGRTAVQVIIGENAY